MTAKKRLDTLLVDRGLAESRSKAAASILAGAVRLGPQRERAAKPGMLVSEEIRVEVEHGPRYVSRGGLKLERALACFDISPRGRLCLDVGASTGGFTDCLLAGGAAHVVALDVAYGELHWKLRQDPRVERGRANERPHARAGRPSVRPGPRHDRRLVHRAREDPAGGRAVCGREVRLLALVKPHFELGRGRVGKGGVVRRPEDRLEALVGVGEAARALDLSVQGYVDSGHPGPAGNRESFIWCAGGVPERVEDLVAAARVAEPEAAEPAGARR